MTHFGIEDNPTYSDGVIRGLLETKLQWRVRTRQHFTNSFNLRRRRFLAYYQNVLNVLQYLKYLSEGIRNAYDFVPRQRQVFAAVGNLVF